MRVSEGELESWGRRIGAEIATPAFLGLRGPLGAGKSVLARSVARGAGVTGALPSPSFNLLFRYSSPRGIQVVHMDLYRIGHLEELWELGWEELGACDELVLIEWCERAGDLLPDDRWEIELRPTGRELRELLVNCVGEPPPLPRPYPGSVGNPGVGVKQ